MRITSALKLVVSSLSLSLSHFIWNSNLYKREAALCSVLVFESVLHGNTDVVRWCLNSFVMAPSLLLSQAFQAAAEWNATVTVELSERKNSNQACQCASAVQTVMGLCSFVWELLYHQSSHTWENMMLWLFDTLLSCLDKNQLNILYIYIYDPIMITTASNTAWLTSKM